MIKSFVFFIYLIFSANFLFADETVKPACFRLEGNTMSCAGGGGGEVCEETCEGTYPDLGNACSGQVIGTICGGKVKCYGRKCCDTCESLQDRYCGSFKVCQGTSEEKTCTGVKPPTDCSSITYCVRITEQQGTIGKSGTCIGSYTPGFRCGSPISAGDGCSCTCQRNEAEQRCEGVDNGKCTRCECGTEQTQNPNYINYCKNITGTCAVRESVPAERYGECGCRCPDPGGSYGTPVCSSCGVEDYKCIVPPTSK